MPREESGRCLYCGPDGVRRKGGVSRPWACAGNVRTWPVHGMEQECWHPPGDSQAAESVRDRVPEHRPGADRPVGAMTPGNAGRAKGTEYPDVDAGQP